ncbi:MAG TPA: transcription elongation factor GreA [Nitrospiria bacterium]|nr:transcription elongation factor GreA [Nitrospiria bacterium]
MRVPITKKGFEQLRDELDRLRKTERPKVIQAIAEARAHGDLSENAEYHAAKERQSFVEGRIKELETKMANAEIIETGRLTADKVVFGATVTLLEADGKTKKKYMLVGEDESDLKNGKISVTSPVGKALIGHKVGDEVTITTPARTVTYEILDIAIA